MPLGTGFPRLEALGQHRLEAMGRELVAQWHAKGCPDFDLMPRRWVYAINTVQAEFDRRGQQLRLF